MLNDSKFMAQVITKSLFSVEELAPGYEARKPMKKTYGIPEVKLSYVRETLLKSNTSPDDFEAIFRKHYDTGEIDFHEVMFVAYVNRQNAVIGVQRIGTGTATMSPCDIKALFAGALLCRAEGIVLCHNHPSGTLRPSYADDNMTRKVRDAAKLLEMNLLDHLILTHESYYSYANERGISSL